MRNSELKDFAPEIERRMDLPESRVKDLRRRVRATDLATKYATEFFKRIMDDAQTDQEEAWDECAQLLGFRNLDDLEKQDYAMVLYGSQLQLRKIKDSPNEQPD